MVDTDTKALIYQKIYEYIDILNDNSIKIGKVYLYGSYTNGSYNKNSDIDLAIFLDVDDIDGFEEDALLMKLRRKVDLNIEPHAFAKTDFDSLNPFVNEIIKHGEKII